MWDVFGIKRRKRRRISAHKEKLQHFSKDELVSLAKHMTRFPPPMFRDQYTADLLYAISELLREEEKSTEKHTVH